MKPRSKQSIPAVSHASASVALAEYLAALIPRQVELGSQAVQCNEGALASLVACQIFDLLDWSRTHLNPSAMTRLRDCILADLSAVSLHFNDLQQLEEYAETHFAVAD